MKNAKSQLSSLKNPAALGAGELAAVDGGGGGARPHDRSYREPETFTVTSLPSVDIHGHERDGWHSGTIQYHGETLYKLDAYETAMAELAANEAGYETRVIEKGGRWV